MSTCDYNNMERKAHDNVHIDHAISQIPQRCLPFILDVEIKNLYTLLRRSLRLEGYRSLRTLLRAAHNSLWYKDGVGNRTRRLGVGGSSDAARARRGISAGRASDIRLRK